MRKQGLTDNIDWLTILLYLVLCFIGWVNIYAADYNANYPSMFDMDRNYGKQFVWIMTSIVIGAVILIIDSKFYTTFAYPIYIFMIVLLIAVLLFGKEVSGARSWFELGPFKVQPSEFMKFATNLAIAKFLSGLNVSLRNLKTIAYSILLFMVPAVLIALQPDAGSALVYTGLLVVLFRFGFSAQLMIYLVAVIVLSIAALLIDKYTLLVLFIVAGILLLVAFRKKREVMPFIIANVAVACIYVFAVSIGFTYILKPHQQQRIMVLFHPEDDLQGAAYNVNQSKIAIGSGGFYGKGFLNGTQTQFDFVPEQSTDFIFCTIGEEHGYIGSTIVVGLFLALLLRLVFIAERQRSVFTRIYAYGVAMILFMHITVNIGMTIGLAPVIGIPLPFISYGGSSLWAFTILLFILLRLDGDRLAVLR